MLGTDIKLFLKFYYSVINFKLLQKDKIDQIKDIKVNRPMVPTFFRVDKPNAPKLFWVNTPNAPTTFWGHCPFNTSEVVN